MNHAELEQKVIDIVADALSHDRATVRGDSSLMDDLGAESIDFIDIVFRLEGDLGILIPNEELWAGSIDASDASPDAIARGVEQLRARMPGFRWDRFPDGVTKKDLPRLITVNTITDYLQKRLTAEGRLAV